jgi:putative transposase
MCRVLGVSPGGYYARQKRTPAARAGADAKLSERIAEIHRDSRATYGAPRIHAELRAQGIKVGGKRVARLMRAAKLYGVSRRHWMTTTVRDHQARPASDLVERNFSAAAPNRLWVADITYIPTWAASSIWRWCSTFSAAASWARRWRSICAPSWCCRRSTWHSGSDALTA